MWKDLLAHKVSGRGLSDTVRERVEQYLAFAKDRKADEARDYSKLQATSRGLAAALDKIGHDGASIEAQKESHERVLKITKYFIICHNKDYRK